MPRPRSPVQTWSYTSWKMGDAEPELPWEPPFPTSTREMLPIAHTNHVYMLPGGQNTSKLGESPGQSPTLVPKEGCMVAMHWCCPAIPPQHHWPLLFGRAALDGNLASTQPVPRSPTDSHTRKTIFSLKYIKVLNSWVCSSPQTPSLPTQAGVEK